MKLKSAIFILLILFLNILLYSNEKEVFDKNKILFNFNKTTFAENKKIKDHDTDEYIRKANGFLAMGIIGIILTNLSVILEIGFVLIICYLVPSLFYLIYFSFSFILAPLLGLGVAFILNGFITYQQNRYKKTPNPFSSNKTSFIKFNISLKGANNV